MSAPRHDRLNIRRRGALYRLDDQLRTNAKGKNGKGKPIKLDADDISRIEAEVRVLESRLVGAMG